eukprot:5145908-Prymnesium_polylepis.1
MSQLSTAKPRPKRPDWVIDPTLSGGTRATIGSTSVPYRQAAPSYGFGTSDRAQCEKLFLSNAHARANAGAKTPGPGSYNHAQSTGKQAMSTQTDAAAYGFGSST